MNQYQARHPLDGEALQLLQKLSALVWHRYEISRVRRIFHFNFSNNRAPLFDKIPKLFFLQIKTSWI